MGCPGGTRSVFTGTFQAKKRTSMYFSQEKGEHDYIQTQHNDLFFPLQSFSRKTSRKIGPKSAVNTKRVYRIVLMPPVHPIILLLINSIWPPYQ